MAAEIGVSRDGTQPAIFGRQATGWSARARAWVRWPVSHWELIVAALAVVAAAVAFWVTLHAHFLQYPGWLAVQKADFILGPIGVGLYWHHRRPHNCLGLLLIGLGLAGVPYILTSLTNPTLFGLGIADEVPIYVLTSAVILAFPSGRIEGLAAKLTLAVSVVVNLVAYAVLLLTDPYAGPGFSISGCRAACPANGLAIWSTPAWFPTFSDAYGVLLVAIPIATAGVLVWRVNTGTPPRRRALAIGAPIALLFLATQASYRVLFFLSPDGFALNHAPIHSALQWTFATARSFIWYGFLFALIAAELYAARVLRRLNRDSLGRPSFRELEGLLRGPLGDPGLRLGFWHAESREWVDAEGVRLAAPGAGQEATEVDRDGRAVILIVHDQHLSDDPELLQAAGAVALLALENAELDSAWKESLRELAESRARLAAAGDRERRKLERDLHDSAQQRFVAAEINLALASDLATDNPQLVERITEANMALEDGLEELREIAHGIYPRELARWGLPRALNLLAARYPGKATATHADVGRAPPEIEATVYYGCLEAVQNASKHAGRDAHITIRLHKDADQLLLEVRDNGCGFDPNAVDDGIGLQNIRDRFGAVGGRAEIRSQPGRGTVMLAAAPLGNRPTGDTEPAMPGTSPPSGARS